MFPKAVDLSVVLPAYREAENLKSLLPQLYGVLGGAGLTFEVIVVDATTKLDDTESVCKEVGVTHIRRSGNDSYGDAVRAGILAASGKHCVFMDADGSHPPEIILLLLSSNSEADVVVASRYVKGGGTENSRVLIWMSLLLNWVFATLLRVQCRDISNSFKLYRTEMLKQLELRATDFDVIEEIMFCLVKGYPSLRIKEVPFRFRRRVAGQSKRRARFLLSFFVTLLRLRISAWRR